MAASVVDRARAYVAKMEPAIDGAGGHSATFEVAQVLTVGFSLSVDEAMPLMFEYNQRCQPPWTERELLHKVRSSSGGSRLPQGYLLGDQAPDSPKQGTGKQWTAPPKAERPAYESELLEKLAAPMLVVVSPLWLADRSKLDPVTVDAKGFLSAMYGADEKALVFTNQRTQGQAIWPDQDPPETGPHGVWFLPQPVTGKSRPNPRTGKFSRRSEESVTEFRYLVLESDLAPPKEWVAILVQLPMRISAIYTSGGRSVHALVRVGCRTKGEWDEEKRRMEPVLNALIRCGMDPGVLSAVRLSRLPGCFREEKRGWQRLVYLQPNPQLRPIAELPRVRDAESEWAAVAALGISDADETGGALLKQALHIYGRSSERLRQAREAMVDMIE